MLVSMVVPAHMVQRSSIKFSGAAGKFNLQIHAALLGVCLNYFGRFNEIFTTSHHFGKLRLADQASHCRSGEVAPNAT